MAGPLATLAELSTLDNALNGYHLYHATPPNCCANWTDAKKPPPPTAAPWS